MVRRLIPITIIILGIIIPPVIVHAVAGWAGVAGFYLACMAYLAWLAWGAPIMDELFPPEDRLPARGHEDRAMGREPQNISNLNATEHAAINSGEVP